MHQFLTLLRDLPCAPNDTVQKQSSIAKTTEARVEECNPIFFLFFVCDLALLLIVLIMA